MKLNRRIKINPTIQTAMNLVTGSAVDMNRWKAKTLGLQMVLLGLAEVQALRVSNLSGTVVHLEERVFQKENLENLTLETLVALYELANKSLGISSDFIKDTLRRTDWDRFEDQIFDLKEKAKAIEHDNTVEVDEIANQLLKRLRVIKSVPGNKKLKRRHHE